MKIVGFLFILNPLIIGAWYVFTQNPKPLNNLFAIIFIVASMFIGMCLIFPDRAMELSLKHIGSLKRAAQQAQVDANEIATMKTEIEGELAHLKQDVATQENAIALIEESSTKAHELIEDLESKTSDVEKTSSEILKEAGKAKKSIAELQGVTTFFTLLTSAQCDNRIAFNNLASWAENPSFKYWQQAASAATQIRVQYTGPITPGFMNHPTQSDLIKRQFDFMKIMYNQSINIYRPSIVNIVWNREDISLKDKMAFMAGVLKEDISLKATYFAGKFFIEGSADPNLTWSPFNVQPLLDWWKKNSDSIK